jgi:hypothetical protein
MRLEAEITSINLSRSKIKKLPQKSFKHFGLKESLRQINLRLELSAVAIR